jgi:outer membrane murein-binding lipoprotein Lpp
MTNEELLVTIQDMFEKKVEEVKQHTCVLLEGMQRDIKAIAEGHVLLNEKMDRLETKVDRLEIRVDRLETKVDRLETKVDRLEMRVDRLETEMSTVKNYVIAVDAKLNEHEMILKRVK